MSNEDQINQLEERITVLEDKLSSIYSGSDSHVRENRKYDILQIREIFEMSYKQGFSGYKIAKIMNENAPFIYNILKRKIYKDVDVRDIVS